jgi:S1/P1 nuclease
MAMKRAVSGMLILSALMFWPQVSSAWNKAGHMLTGAIAYQTLKNDNDQDTIDKVVAVLVAHPENANWQKGMQRHTKEDRELYLFMHAARWPDDARDDPKVYPPDAHFDKLHYINIPYKPDSEPASLKTKAPDDINVFRGYTDKFEVLKGTGKDFDRAVALCWVAHLVGDVHQPLHTTSLFSTKFKNGDRGGTYFYIRAKEGKFPITLHKYWDDLLLSSEGFQNVKNYAIELRNRKEFARDQLTELANASFQDWATKESFAIAREAVYRNGKLQGASDRNKAPVLPDDYAKTAQPIAERRAVLAGYRLAALLKKTLQ